MQNVVQYGARSSVSVLLGALCIKETLLLWWTQGKQLRMSGSLRFRPSVPGNEGANTVCISKYKQQFMFQIINTFCLSKTKHNSYIYDIYFKYNWL